MEWPAIWDCPDTGFIGFLGFHIWNINYAIITPMPARHSGSIHQALSITMKPQNGRQACTPQPQCGRELAIGPSRPPPSLPHTEATWIKHSMLVLPTKDPQCRRARGRGHLRILKLHDQESYQKKCAVTFLDRLLSYSGMRNLSKRKEV